MLTFKDMYLGLYFFEFNKGHKLIFKLKPLILKGFNYIRTYPSNLISGLANFL